MEKPTTRAAHVMAFNAEGRHAGDFTARNRADWHRINREARERAGKDGTVFLYAATVQALTGKLASVAASPMIHRAGAGK